MSDISNSIALLREARDRHEADAVLIAQLVEALEKTEWDSESYCPECHRGYDIGHNDDCSIAAVLETAREPAEAGKALLERLRRYEALLRDMADNDRRNHWDDPTYAAARDVLKEPADA